MSKIKDFFIGLNKSTKLTMLSCGCFIVLTFLILCFFVMFPITPSERAISSLGREGLVYNNGNQDSAVTTSVTENGAETGTGTTTRTTTTTRITVSGFIGADVTTVGSGYYSGNVIPTGGYVYEPMETVTTTVSPSYTDPGVTTDNPSSTETPTTSPTEPTDPPVTNPTDPPVTDQPTTDPVDPPVTDVPADPVYEN